MNIIVVNLFVVLTEIYVIRYILWFYTAQSDVSPEGNNDKILHLRFHTPAIKPCPV